MASSDNDSSDNDSRLSAAELARAAMVAVGELTGYRPEAATALDWDDDSDAWLVTVEVLELSRVPNTTDVIGAYEVRLDPQGSLRGYRRVRRYSRGETREE
jgi:hypothetical protein